MRHSQFSTRLRRRKKLRQKTFSNVVIFLVVLIPIYPAFGSYMQEYTGAVVRGDYDRSTIIDAYDGTTGQETIEDTVDVETDDQVVEPPVEEIVPVPPQVVVTQPIPADTPSKIIDDKKRALYTTHIVRSGDNLWSIAQKYGVSLSQLRSKNNLANDRLSINQKIIIPQISGVQYSVEKWDTLITIAEKYGIKDIDTILIANDMTSGATLRVGRSLLLPHPTKDPAKKIVAQPTPKAPEKKTVAQKITTPAPAKVTPKKEVVNTQQTISYGGYTLDLKVTKGCRWFVWGNCTCFVAKYKKVTWRGNAKDWLRNAQRQWVSTGKSPKPGAIIVYHGPGFPPAYGHVGIVMEVGENDMIIKDMNYRALNEITTRRESFDNPAIIGYIYVD